MKVDFLKGTLHPSSLVQSLKYKADFKKQHPGYFDPEGLLVFCGPQGSGKTLSAVQYCRKILARYPECKFVTNVDISGLPASTEVIEYDGIRTLSDVQNGYKGVLYLIDEIHLEFNSLESKSISIEEMTEFAQQRKQRKHIVGTSQVFMRLANAAPGADQAGGDLRELLWSDPAQYRDRWHYSNRGRGEAPCENRGQLFLAAYAGSLRLLRYFRKDAAVQEGMAGEEGWSCSAAL